MLIIDNQMYTILQNQYLLNLLDRTGVTEKSLDNQLIIEGFLFSYTLDN